MLFSTFWCLLVLFVLVKSYRKKNKKFKTCFYDLKYNTTDILFYNEDFDKVTLIAKQRHIVAVDIDKINLDNDNNFYDDDSDTIIHVRLLVWRNEFQKRKAFKKDE